MNHHGLARTADVVFGNAARGPAVREEPVLDHSCWNETSYLLGDKRLGKVDSALTREEVVLDRKAATTEGDPVETKTVKEVENGDEIVVYREERESESRNSRYTQLSKPWEYIIIRD